MALLNYTTKVDAGKTVAEVHAILVKAGAHQVMTDYRDGRPAGIAFALDTPYGPRTFILPCNAEAVLKALKRDRVEPRYQSLEQAERVAWRIIKDWLEAQLAFIRTGMVSLDEIMLPYMRGEDGRTMYELYVNTQPALTAGA